MNPNRHFSFFNKRTNSIPIKWIELLEYGLSQLDMENRPDQDLAEYFFWISENETVPGIVRDFALDVMLTAEDSYPIFTNVGQIEQLLLQKIKPLLNNQ